MAPSIWRTTACGAAATPLARCGNPRSSQNNARAARRLRAAQRAPLGAARILDHDHGNALAARVLGRVAYAEIERQPSNEDAHEAPLAQIAGQSGGRLAVVLVKGGVGIDRGAEALSQDELCVRNSQVVVELGADRAL